MTPKIYGEMNWDCERSDKQQTKKKRGKMKRREREILIEKGEMEKERKKSREVATGRGGETLEKRKGASRVASELRKGGGQRSLPEQRGGESA